MYRSSPCRSTLTYAHGLLLHVTSKIYPDIDAIYHSKLKGCLFLFAKMERGQDDAKRLNADNTLLPSIMVQWHTTHRSLFWRQKRGTPLNYKLPGDSPKTDENLSGYVGVAEGNFLPP